MRKEAGFKVTDRIRLFYSASTALSAAIEGRREHIGREVLADSISAETVSGDFHRDWDIDGEKITIGIQRI
jgi:hypothetical protein